MKSKKFLQNICVFFKNFFNRNSETYRAYSRPSVQTRTTHTRRLVGYARLRVQLVDSCARVYTYYRVAVVNINDESPPPRLSRQYHIDADAFGVPTSVSARAHDNRVTLQRRADLTVLFRKRISKTQTLWPHGSGGEFPPPPQWSTRIFVWRLQQRRHFFIFFFFSFIRH